MIPGSDPGAWGDRDHQPLLVELTVRRVAGSQVSWLITFPGTVNVFTFDAAAVAANKIFSILVFDMT